MPNPLTFEEFSCMIVEKEMYLMVRSSSNKAYTMNSKGNGKSKDSSESSNRNEKMKLFYCGKKLHMVMECRKK